MTLPSDAARREPPWILVQARTGSERLPAKVLADVCGRPLLTWLIERVRGAHGIAGVAVLTSDQSADDVVADLGKRLGVDVFRGHPTDVLDRFWLGARQLGAGAVVRLSGDSPLLDRFTVEAVVEDFRRGGAELVCNHRASGWPVGTAVEVMTAALLERLHADANDPAHREHVTLYAYEHTREFAIRQVPAPPEVRAPELRLCVDTAADLDYIRSICRTFAPRRDFALSEVVGHWRAEGL